MALIVEKSERDVKQLVDQIMAVPAWATFVTEACSVQDEGDKLVLAPGADMLPDPDDQSTNLVQLKLHGAEIQVSGVALYDSCPVTLVRDTVGCENCEFKPKGCGLPEAVELLKNSGHGVTPDGMSKALERVLEKATPEGFQWVPPHLTAGSMFKTRYRCADDIDFSDKSIEDRKDELSHRGEAAATTRAFKDEQCSKCPAKNMGCDAAQRCEGAYPEEVTIWSALLNMRDDIMSKSQWTWEQIESLSTFEGTFHINRCEYVFLGFQVFGDGVLYAVARRATWMARVEKYKNVAELAEAFKPKRKRDPNPIMEHLATRKPAQSREHARLLFLLWAGTIQSDPRPNGFGPLKTQTVYGARLSYASTHVTYGKSERYQYLWKDRSMDTLHDYFDFTKLLPAKQTKVRVGRYVRQGRHVYSFDLYMPNQGNG